MFQVPVNNRNGTRWENFEDENQRKRVVEFVLFSNFVRNDWYQLSLFTDKSHGQLYARKWRIIKKKKKKKYEIIFRKQFLSTFFSITITFYVVWISVRNFTSPNSILQIWNIASYACRDTLLYILYIIVIYTKVDIIGQFRLAKLSFIPSKNSQLRFRPNPDRVGRVQKLSPRRQARSITKYKGLVDVVSCSWSAVRLFVLDESVWGGYRHCSYGLGFS